MQLTLFLISFGLSVKKIDELPSDELILDLAPCKAGKKLECIKAGFGTPSLGATSLVILKYGSFKFKQAN